MKVSKIPGLGSFGHYIDDVNLDEISPDEWMEIGKLHLEGLVTILRNVTVSKDNYLKRINQFGPLQSTMRSYLVKKYGHDFDTLKPETYADFDDEDRAFLNDKKFLYEHTENGTTLTRVSGKLDENGNPTGVFSNGDLAWHSNEGAHIAFAPTVSLLGGEHMTNSSTGFLQTVDYYNSLTESFRSELDEMVLIHAYRPGSINEREKQDLMLERQIRLTMCPQNGMETPLVVTSPGGHRGIRYTMHTASSIKGMTQEESDKVFDELDKALLDQNNVYDHWYQQDNDLLLFDNCVTQHRRIGGHPDRVAYRYQYFPQNLLKEPWQPYDNKYYADEYNRVKEEIEGRQKVALGY